VGRTRTHRVRLCGSREPNFDALPSLMPGERGPTVDNSRLLDYGAATSSHPKNNRGGRPHLRPPPLGMTDIASLTKTFLKACRKTIAITGTTTLYSRSRSYNSFYVTELLQR